MKNSFWLILIGVLALMLLSLFLSLLLSLSMRRFSFLRYFFCIPYDGADGNNCGGLAELVLQF